MSPSSTSWDDGIFTLFEISKYAPRFSFRGTRLFPEPFHLIFSLSLYQTSYRASRTIRPETEELVDHAIEILSSSDRDRERDVRVLDVGAGSGCVGLALLHACPNISVVACDISLEAVRLASENASELSVSDRYRCVHASVSGLRDELGSDHAPFDMLVSNPPYIPTSRMRHLEREVYDHEDHGALCGGNEGLDVVREILDSSPELLVPSAPIVLELDASHPEILEEWLHDLPMPYPVEFVEWHRDLQGKPRFCVLRVTSET